MAGMSRSRCIEPHKRIDQVMDTVEELEVEGAAYSAGTAIDPAQLASLVIAVMIDGVSIVTDGDGKLAAVAASDLTEGPGVDITAGVVSAQVDGTTAFLVGDNIASWTPGDGLETSSTTLSVKAHTYIDVSANGVAVDFTEVSGYSGAADQYLRNNAGSFLWDTLPSGGGGVYFLATVNEASHVVGATSTFSFDNTSAMGPSSPPSSGTCNNTYSRAFIDNEKFLCFGNGSGTYYALKVSPNIAFALVNQAAGVSLSDSTFPIDGFTSIVNAVPSSATASNSGSPPQQLKNNQQIPVVLQDDGNWQPLVTYGRALFRTTGTISARSGSSPTWTWGTGNATMMLKSSDTQHTTTGGTSVTLKNSSTFTIPSGRIVQAKMIDGDWFIDVDDCG